MTSNAKLADTIEELLVWRRRSLFIEQLIEDIREEYHLSISPEQINALVLNEPERFSYDSNGSVMLQYEKTFWRISDELQNQYSHSGSSLSNAEPVILFVLRLLTRPGLLVKLGLNYSEYEKLPLEVAAKNILQELDKHSSLFSGQMESFIKLASRIHWKGFTEFKPLIKLIPDYYFGICYADLFRRGNRNKAEFTEPNSTCAELIAALASTISANRVLDPFAGIGSFITELKKIQLPTTKQFYWLNDFDPSLSVYGKMNLLLNNINDFTYTTEDAFLQQIGMRADLVLTNPPLFRSKEQKSIIECVLNQLSASGQAFVIVPDSYLYSSRYRMEREMLIRKNQLRSVISLPSGLFKPYASIKTSILHIVKNSYSNDPVLFIKTDDVTNEELRDKIPELKQCFIDRTVRDDTTQLASTEQILANDTILSVPLYFTPAIRSQGNYELGQLVKQINNIGSYRLISKAIVNNQGIGIPVIRAASLADSKESIYLNIANVKNFTNQLKGTRLPKNTLLLSLTGPNLKPTLVDTTNELFIDGRSVIPFQIIQEKVMPEYLAYYLYEADVLSQIRSYYQGTSILYISRENLSKIKIHVPDRNEQKLYIEEKRRNLNVNLIQSREETSYERFSTLKHSMAQPLRTLSSDFSTLMAFLEEKSLTQIPINLSDYTAPIFDGEDVKDLEKIRLFNVADRINKSVKYLQNSLNKVDALIKTSVPLDAKPIQLRQLIEKVLDINKDNTYSYRVIGPEVIIKADQFLLEAAFSYLIENAVKHGFDYNQSKNKNSIIAEIIERRFDNVEILLKNNGRRMAEGMDNEHIFEKGRTSDKRSGSGFGGFVVNEIVKKHQGTIEIFSLPADMYPVQFKITLPI